MAKKKNLTDAQKRAVVRMLKAGKKHKEIMTVMKNSHKVKVNYDQISRIRKNAGIPGMREISAKKREKAAVMMTRGMTNSQINEKLKAQYGTGLDTEVLRDIRKVQGASIPATSAEHGGTFDLGKAEDDLQQYLGAPLEMSISKAKIDNGEGKLLSKLMDRLAKKDVVEAKLDIKRRKVSYKYMMTGEVIL